jgi:hypothetical protein
MPVGCLVDELIDGSNNLNAAVSRKVAKYGLVVRRLKVYVCVQECEERTSLRILPSPACKLGGPLHRAPTLDSNSITPI